MTFQTIASLLGGIGLFLLGMRMMTDGLKVAAGNALRSILDAWTRTAARGLLAGILITAIVQSSSAATVATVGFVNAGLMTLTQAIWVVFGMNVGTTMTGWLVALVGVKIDVGALALPLLGVGMLARILAGANVRRAGIGETLAGFGAFFLGVGVLQGAFADLAPRLAEWPLESLGAVATPAFVGLGFLLTVLTQSSSASIAIVLTATAGGAAPLPLAAAAVIGANVGTTSTALFATFGATSPAKRVATAHIVFNLMTGAVALLALPLLLAASVRAMDWIGGNSDAAATLAAFHTLFNLLGVLLMWPLAAWLVRFLSHRFVSLDEEIGRTAHLDATLADVPALALRALALELHRMATTTFALAERRVRGVVAPSEGSRQQSGIMKLGSTVRHFIVRMSAGALPEDVAAALPDLMRGSQHLEDLASESARVAEPGPGRVTAPREDASVSATQVDWAAVNEAVLATLALDADDNTETLAALDARVVAAYDRLKADRLRDGALGRMQVSVMENELLRARQLRRIADAALNARRRLAPWLARVGDGEAVEVASAVTAPVTPGALKPESN